MKTILLILLMVCCSLGSSCQTYKKTRKMLEYIPKEFNKVELGFNQSEENACTPQLPESLTAKSQIMINMPKKIICKDLANLIIPLCGMSEISQRRGLKYAHLKPVINVRKIGEETWYQGKIVDLKSRSPLKQPDYYEKEKRRQQRIAEAQKYSDDELDDQDGIYFGTVFNVDIVPYFNEISFQEGVYEIYLSKSGLESNRVRVEIILTNK